MSPKNPAADAPAALNGADVEFSVTLSEWALQTSATDKRIELLNAFAAEESAKGNHRALPSEYRKRYQAFADRPVQ